MISYHLYTAEYEMSIALIDGELSKYPDLEKRLYSILEELLSIHDTAEERYLSE